MRILFFSEMTISPASGGGWTVMNLLEPPPDRCEVFYASPVDRAAHWHPFPEIAARIRTFPNGTRAFVPPIRRALRYSAVRRVSAMVNRFNVGMGIRVAASEVVRLLRILRIDVLLACPQSRFDLAVAASVVRKTRIPMVTWFMDDYFADDTTCDDLRTLWNASTRRFVISDAMNERFAALGGEAAVLNNSVAFPDQAPRAPANDAPPLRIVYAGALNFYYVDAFRSVLDDLRDAHELFRLDVYTHDPWPCGLPTREHSAYRRLPPLPASRMREALMTYDVLLILSSFRPEHRRLAETSLASKWADYFSAGRCIVVYGPDYAENVRYAERNGVAEIVRSAAPGRLREALLQLAGNRGRRNELGRAAFAFGKRTRDVAMNRESFWEALQRAATRSASSGRPA